MVESRNAESIITGIVTDGGNITTSGVLEIGTATDATITFDSSPTITWKPPTLEAFTVTIDGKVLLQGKELSKQYFESIEQRIINLETREDYAMFTTMNILIIMLIVIVTVKFVMPKLTIKYILRKFANLVYKPGKKAKEEIEVEWEKAKVE